MKLIVRVATVVAIIHAAAEGQLLVQQSMYGMNTHVPTAALLNKCQAGNIAWARIDLDWFALQPTRTTYNWSSIDAVVSAASSRGINLYATLAYTPAWANGGLDRTVPPTNPEDWKNFVRTVVNRYKANIRCWGLWNEPDISQFFSGTTSQYINIILVPGAQAVREADPTALRCAPDLAGNSNFLRDVLNGAKDSIDVVTLHKYDEQVSQIMRKWDGTRWPWEDPNYKSVLQSTGAWGKAVWFTEVGWPTADGTFIDTVTEAQQAGLYTQLLDQVRQRTWINKIFFYELRDDPTAGVPKWGILNSDSSEKLAFAAYRDNVALHPPSAGPTVTDLRRYALATLSMGSPYLSDRSYTITSMPAYLEGRQGIRTIGGDAGATAESWIDFDVDCQTEVYVAYDRRATSLPNWMSSYQPVGETIGVSDPDQAYADLYRNTVPMGEVVMGANLAPGASGALANYFVIVIPAGTGLPYRAVNPGPASGATQVSVSTKLGWTAGAAASSHNVYFGKSDPGDFRGSQVGTLFDPGPLDRGTTYYWRIDEVNASGVLTGDVWYFTTKPPPGDMDQDGDVDQEDFGFFQVCLTSSVEPQIAPPCQAADFNTDGVINALDLGMLLACVSGPEVPIARMCYALLD